MAGSKDLVFREKLTPYLREQMASLERAEGTDSAAYRALHLQYITSPLEKELASSDRLRHYESEMHVVYEQEPLRGVERLYRRAILIEPSTVCAAHCRWCLRGQYELSSLREDEITRFAKYCGSAGVRDDIREILVTGGDPFMVPKRLDQIISDVKNHAPNIEIFRIATRVPIQDPARVNADLLSILKAAAPVKLEIATHVNHPVELTREARTAYEALYQVAFKIYDQTVLLKGVNDDVATLSELYDSLRYLGIEAHYLFHCIPMRGMSHHRTSLKKGLRLISEITCSGAFSGRAKPMFTVMTDIGKITLYEGTVLDRDKMNNVLLQSYYRIETFRSRNPSWVLPDSASVDKDGFLRVWYPDGTDEYAER